MYEFISFFFFFFCSFLIFHLSNIITLYLNNILTNRRPVFYALDPHEIRQYFVGASDIYQEGVWEWTKLNSQNYFSWQGTQPNNRDNDFNGEEADCGIYYTGTWKMRDEFCYQSLRFICEK